MKSCILSCIFLVVTAVVSGQAKISFKNTTVKYDNVKPNSEGSRTFTFQNTGDQALVIKKVSSTSHYLTVSKPNQSIAPGDTGEIKVKYDTKKKGPIRRTITVYSNAKNKPVTALKVIGCVVDK